MKEQSINFSSINPQNLAFMVLLASSEWSEIEKKIMYNTIVPKILQIIFWHFFNKFQRIFSNASVL